MLDIMIVYHTIIEKHMLFNYVFLITIEYLCFISFSDALTQCQVALEKQNIYVQRLINISNTFKFGTFKFLSYISCFCIHLVVTLHASSVFSAVGSETYELHISIFLRVKTY